MACAGTVSPAIYRGSKALYLSTSKRVFLNVLPYEQPKGLVITHKEYRTKVPILEHVVTSGLALDFGRS